MRLLAYFLRKKYEIRKWKEYLTRILKTHISKKFLDFARLTEAKVVVQKEFLIFDSIS